MNKQFLELLEDLSPEDREEAEEKVIDLKAEMLVRQVKKALEEAGFKSL